MGAWVTDFSPVGHYNTTVKEVFSTLTSPVFSELVIVLPGHGANALRWEPIFFKTLRWMYKFRPFKLVFLPEGPFFGREGVTRLEVAEALDSATANGFLSFLDSPPSVR